LQLDEAIDKVLEYLEPHFEDVPGLQEAWELIRDSLPFESGGCDEKDIARMHIEKALELLKRAK